MLTIELDSVQKWRNRKEWRDVQRASCDGLEVIGDHRVIEALARKLTEHHPEDTPAEVRRAGALVFHPNSLGAWARGRVGKGEQPEHLKSGAKRQPHSDGESDGS